MPTVRHPSGLLTMGGVSLEDATGQVGTPVYVYDIDAIAAEARDLRRAFDGSSHLVAYAVKANSAGPIVRALAREGCGADVVSGGELAVTLACGIPAERTVYSGVAKRDAEIDAAIECGPNGIAAIQMESVEEIVRVAARAKALGRKARVSLRINPSIDLKDLTHSHIATGHDAAKFGVPRVDVARAVELVGQFPELDLVGVAAHVGSQFGSVRPYVESAKVVFEVARDIRASGRHRLAFIDTGGGFGIDYRAGPLGEDGPAATESRQPRPSDFVRAVRAEQRTSGLQDLALYVEPGRSLVAAHGVLVGGVLQTKVSAAGRWLLIDAGMNDLLRPALYQAHHRVVPMRVTPGAPQLSWRVVGPVCESSDDFGVHILPANPGAAVVILDAGAYGYTMASTYNGRPLPAEVFLSGGRVVGLTPRGSIEEWARDRAAAGMPKGA